MGSRHKVKEAIHIKQPHHESWSGIPTAPNLQPDPYGSIWHFLGNTRSSNDYKSGSIWHTILVSGSFCYLSSIQRRRSGKRSDSTGRSVPAGTAPVASPVAAGWDRAWNTAARRPDQRRRSLPRRCDPTVPASSPAAGRRSPGNHNNNVC